MLYRSFTFRKLYKQLANWLKSRYNLISKIKTLNLHLKFKMSATKILSGDDQVSFDKALELKNKGVEHHKNKNKEMAKRLTHEALKEIEKVGDSTNMEVVELKSNICQNLAQFHKQS